MTIGPAPMMSTLRMSVLFGMLFHHLREAVEQVADVVRPRARLRMPLKAEGGTIRPRQSLEGTVEERNVRSTEIVAYGGRIHREPMVLAGDHHLAGVEVLHRMIRAVVAELHLQRLRAGGE